MTWLRPRTWEEALAIRAAHPHALPIAGGTDIMPVIGPARRRIAAGLDLTGLAELASWERRDGEVWIGARTTYSTLGRDLADVLPALAHAARIVGSPQIRNRATIGGNLGSASPAGDCHPPLLALDACVEVASIRGARSIPVREFYLGPRRTVLAADELIHGLRLPLTGGPQHFTKVGVRSAMTIAASSFAIALHPSRRTVGTGIGSAGPTPLRADAAEAYLESELRAGDYWSGRRALPDSVVRGFAELVAATAKPIDDVRSTADYRRHALTVLSRRALLWTWDDFRRRQREDHRQHQRT